MESPRTLGFESLTANLSGKVRHETLHGREYIVAPLTMIVPGVLAGSKGPLFYPEDEVSKNPTAWNGMPIVVNHPMRDGVPVEARSPRVLEESQIGTVFNTEYNGKLGAEGWFDVERTKAINSAILNQIMAGKPIELSTGLYTDNEPFEGTWNGRAYKFVARNYRPDHLAILVGSRGACSIKDGCGVLVNKWSDEARKKSVEARKSKANKRALGFGSVIVPASAATGLSMADLLSKGFRASKKARIVGALAGGSLGLAAVMGQRRREIGSPTTNVIKKTNGKHCVFSESGKSLGGCGSLEKAKKRLQQVEYFKHVANSRVRPEVRILLDIVHNGVYTSALRSIGGQAFKDVKRLGGLSGVAKTGVRKVAAFTRRRPKTALGITGVGAYALGKRKGRQQVQNAIFTKKRLKQAGGFATGAAGGFGGAAAGAAIGQAAIPIPVVGGLIGGAIGAGAGTWGANRVARKFGGKTAEKASDIGGLVGSIASPGMVRGVVKGGAKLLGRGAAKGVTKAATRTGLRAPSTFARIGRAIKTKKLGTAGRVAGAAAGKGVAKMGAEMGAYQGTQAGLDTAFTKQRKLRIPRTTINAWTEEARRKSIEKRKRQSNEMSTSSKVAAGAGTLAGIATYKIAEPDIRHGAKVARRAIRGRVIKSFGSLANLLSKIRK